MLVLLHAPCEPPVPHGGTPTSFEFLFPSGCCSGSYVHTYKLGITQMWWLTPHSHPLPIKHPELVPCHKHTSIPHLT